MTNYVNPEEIAHFIGDNDKEFMLKNTVWSKLHRANVSFVTFKYIKVGDKRVLYVITDSAVRPLADSNLAILKMEDGSSKVKVLSQHEFDEQMAKKKGIKFGVESSSGGKSRRRKSRKVRRTIRRRGSTMSKRG